MIESKSKIIDVDRASIFDCLVCVCLCWKILELHNYVGKILIDIQNESSTVYSVYFYLKGFIFLFNKDALN